MLIGYARTLNNIQDLAGQLAVLKQAGCARIFREKKSRIPANRPELEKLLALLMPRDILVVPRLEHLALSTRDLLAIIDRVVARKGGLRSLAERWADTTARSGKIFITVAAGITEFERTLINSRTAAGRRRAMRQGVRFGPKPKLTPDQVTRARDWLAKGQTAGTVAAKFNCHRATLYRALAG